MSVWRSVTKLVPGDIIEMDGPVVYDVLAIEHSEQTIAVAIQQRSRDRAYFVKMFGRDAQVRMCDPMEGIPLGMRKQEWEYRRAKRDLLRMEAGPLTDEEIGREVRRLCG